MILVVACTSPFEDEKKHYKPWYFEHGPDKLYIKEDLITEEHYDKVIKVLEHYCVEFYRLEPTKIEFAKAVDVDTIMNVRRKAEDSLWWKEHIGNKSYSCNSGN